MTESISVKWTERSFGLVKKESIVTLTPEHPRYAMISRFLESSADKLTFGCYNLCAFHEIQRVTAKSTGEPITLDSIREWRRMIKNDHVYWTERWMLQLEDSAKVKFLLVNEYKTVLNDEEIYDYDL
jgi:hypothetical protein